MAPAAAAVAVTATEDALLMALLHAAKFPSCAVGGALLGPAAGGGGPSGTVASVVAAVPLFHHPTAAMAACVEAGLAQAAALAASRGLALVGYYHAPVHYAAPVGPRVAAAGGAEGTAAAPRQQQQRGDAGDDAEDDDGGDDDDARRALPPPARRIAERIAERRPPGSGPSVVLALNNPRLARFSGFAGGGGGGGGDGGGGGGAAVIVGGDPPCPFDVYAGPGWQRVPSAAGAAGGGPDHPSPSFPPLRLALASPSSSSSPSSWRGLQRRWLNCRAARLHRSLADFDEHVDDVSRDYTNPDLLDEATRTLVR